MSIATLKSNVDAIATAAKTGELLYTNGNKVVCLGKYSIFRIIYSVFGYVKTVESIECKIDQIFNNEISSKYFLENISEEDLHKLSQRFLLKKIKVFLRVLVRVITNEKITDKNNIEKDIRSKFYGLVYDLDINKIALLFRLIDRLKDSSEEYKPVLSELSEKIGTILTNQHSELLTLKATTQKSR